MDPINQLLKNQYLKLPEDIKKYVLSPELTKNILAIAEAYHIPEEKKILFSNEIFLALMGFSNPQDLALNISQFVKVDLAKEQTRKIANEIEDKIFAPIRESLEKMFSKNMEEQKEEPPKSRETIWHAVSGTKPETATSLMNELVMRDFQEEKNKALEKLTEVSKKLHEQNTTNPALLESLRAEALAIQNRISEIDNELRGLRKNSMSSISQRPTNATDMPIAPKTQ